MPGEGTPGGTTQHPQRYLQPKSSLCQSRAPAAPSLHTHTDVEKPVGVLEVTLVEAKRVPKMDLFTNSSPFVE